MAAPLKLKLSLFFLLFFGCTSCTAVRVDGVDKVEVVDLVDSLKGVSAGDKRWREANGDGSARHGKKKRLSLLPLPAGDPPPNLSRAQADGGEPAAVTLLLATPVIAFPSAPRRS